MTHFKRSILASIAYAGFMIFVYPKFGLDATVTAWYANHAGLGFALRDDVWFSGFWHEGVKKASWLIPFVVLTLWGSTFYRSKNTQHTAGLQHFLDNIRPQRRRIGWLFLGLVVAPLMVTLIKNANTMVCPWNLQIYGGKLLAEPAFAWVGSASAGKCFPGGHASIGFSLLAFYFAFKDGFPRVARSGLCLGVVFGLWLGWVQVMRGAHFVSHNLWTVWVVWVGLLLMYRIYPPVAPRTPNNI